MTRVIDSIIAKLLMMSLTTVRAAVCSCDSLESESAFARKRYGYID